MLVRIEPLKSFIAARSLLSSIGTTTILTRRGPTASQLLVTRQGLTNTVSPIASVPGSGNFIWLQPTENPARREQLWARIHSGDSLTKVMAP